MHLGLFILLQLSQPFVTGDPKPDLFIQEITYSERLYSVVNEPGRPVRADGKQMLGDFAITVGNVGNADFENAFYISWTEYEPENKLRHYSRTSLVNESKGIIPAGGSLVVHVTSPIYKPGTSVMFLIQTDGKPHSKAPLPLIDELSYDNNEFEFRIPERSK